MLQFDSNAIIISYHICGTIVAESLPFSANVAFITFKLLKCTAKALQTKIPLFNKNAAK